jgi:hypothetical protein
MSMTVGGKHAAGGTDGREGSFQKLCRLVWWEEDGKEEEEPGCAATGAL